MGQHICGGEHRPIVEWTGLSLNEQWKTQRKMSVPLAQRIEWSTGFNVLDSRRIAFIVCRYRVSYRELMASCLPSSHKRLVLNLARRPPDDRLMHAHAERRKQPYPRIELFVLSCFYQPLNTHLVQCVDGFKRPLAHFYSVCEFVF